MFDLFGNATVQTISAIVYWCDEEKPGCMRWVTPAVLGAVPAPGDLIMVPIDGGEIERLCVVSVVVHGAVLRVGVTAATPDARERFEGIVRAANNREDGS